jgi:gliding motility-associated-like protein
MILPKKYIAFIHLYFYIVIIISAQTTIVEYPFNGNANDLSGNGLNGIVNNATLTTDRFNQSNNAYYFNGTNASISISYSSLFNFSTSSQFTISLWLQPEIANSIGALFVKSPFNSNYVLSNWDYGLYVINNKSMSGYANNNFLNGTTTMTALGCWYHILVTYNNGIWKLYVNGILEAQDNSGTKFITQSSGGISIGKKGDANGDYFKGKIDDIKVYNSALTSTQVYVLYNNSSTILRMSSKNLNICSGDSAQLLATGGGTYSWSPTTGLSNPNIANPIARPTTSTQYIVTVNTGTCLFKDTVIISVSSCNSAVSCNNCNSSIPINNGLVACYPFNGNANDESGHGNNGVVTGATLTSDRNGNANKAYYFNGTSDYILAPNSSSLQPTSTLSVCAWVKPDVNANQWTPVLSKRYTPSSDPWNSYSIDGGAANNQKWLFSVSKGTAGSQLSAITTQAANYTSWTFLVGTYDGVSQKFYVNGVLDKTISSTGNIGYSTMGFYIGNNNELSQWFKGKIDDVRIYNRALSACEVFTLYNNCSNSLSTNTGNDTTICKGNSVQLNAITTGAVSYRWIPGSGLSDSTIFNPIATPKTTTKYKVIASNGTCSVSDSITISVTDLNANAGLDVFSCKKDFVQLNGSGNGSFTWSPIKFINNITIQNPIVNPDTNIVYFLTVTNGTCISRDTVNVFVTSVDADIFNNDTSICIGDTVTFKTYINGNSFQWKPVSFLNDTNSFTPFAKPDTTTKYFLTVTKGACIKKDSVTITVIKNLVANAGNDQQICVGNSVQLNSSGPFGAVYTWLPNYALSSTTISNPIASPLVDTSYFLKMQLGNNCVGYDTVKIVVNPNPTVDAGLDKNICREPFINIGISSTIADSFYWSPSLGLSNINILQTQASPSHNTTYFIKAINKNTGCFAFDTVTVSLIKPTASFNEDVQTGQVPLDIHFTNTSSNAKNYFWNFGDSSAISSQINPFHIFTKEGLYKVILVAENNGCTDTAEVILHANGELFIFIPNAITANTDGLNDEFVISYTKGALKKLRGTIWNRWGTKIYEFEMPGGKWWDGKMDGQYAETDTFIYIIEATDFNDKTQTFKGNVTLLR